MFARRITKLCFLLLFLSIIYDLDESASPLDES